MVSLSVGLLPEHPPSEPPRGQSVRKWVGVSKLSLPRPKEEWRRVRVDLEGQMRDKRTQIGCTIKTRKCRKIEWNFKRATGWKRMCVYVRCVFWYRTMVILIVSDYYSISFLCHMTVLPLKYQLLLLLSHFSHVQLCDPKDGSPPGSPAPGILQARTLEWVAISFSNKVQTRGSERNNWKILWFSFQSVDWEKVIKVLKNKTLIFNINW